MDIGFFYCRAGSARLRIAVARVPGGRQGTGVPPRDRRPPGPARLSARLLDPSGAELASMARGVILRRPAAGEVRIVSLPDEPIERGRKALDLRAAGVALVGDQVRRVLPRGAPGGRQASRGHKPFPARAVDGEGTLWAGEGPLPGGPGARAAGDQRRVRQQARQERDPDRTRSEVPGHAAAPPPARAAEGGARRSREAPSPGTIAGTLKEGPRPRRASPWSCIMFDPQDKLEGESECEDRRRREVQLQGARPGKYTLTAEKPSSRTRASQQVEVEAGKVVTADLKLSR